ncbi:hypothetical protein [Owenweeksia hongkongensis]|uniref:hypothetical protein n=1 Tax=Owenweeksia hongkongensis TaxID=253245 RepID=UPI003A91FE8A
MGNTCIKLTYLYRDYGNYKLWNELVFWNRFDISFNQIVNTILSHLMEGQFFIPEKWKLPTLSFESFDPDLDHAYHEFHEIELVSEEPTTGEDIAELLLRILKYS